MWSSTLQKIPLVFKFSSLHEALTNEETSVPGYIFEEMTKISFQSIGVCEELLDFLLLTLDTASPVQKLKALKVLKHLAINGPSKFREKLKKSDRTVKEATGFNGPHDAIHGNSINLAIRNEADELMHTLFDNTSDDESSERTLLEQGATNYLSGMGSSLQTGKYEGFGNTPIVVNKTVVDKVVDGISTMVDKIMTVPDDEFIQDALKVDSGNYNAVQLPAEEPIFSTKDHSSQKQLIQKRVINSHIEKHVPGRAGGGWEDTDSDVENESTIGPTNRHNKVSPGRISADSLETEQKLAPETDEAASEEHQLVDNIFDSLSVSKSWMELEILCRRCTALNCEKLLEILQNKLNSDEDTNLAALTFLEALLYQDIVAPDLLQSVFSKRLESFANSSSIKVNIKSKKIMIVLQKLVEHSLM